MELGVCFYPEQWPEMNLLEEFKTMRDIGIQHVRMGEFSWTKLEPTSGCYNFNWLDEAMDAASYCGLKVTLGTPTATPPSWLIQKFPEVLSRDSQGRIRKFGSRRHYCFSSSKYREESSRILHQIAKHYAFHPALFAWQTDNEYGCHDTVLSYSEAAKEGFQKWLEAKYSTIERLNRAWGNIFWSMEYSSFNHIELPNMTVTEANPSHSLDFQRYSSEMVREYNQMQVKILKSYNSEIPIQHNYMGHFTQFDHFDVGQDLDFATWDSYPLGFLEQESYPEEIKQTYYRTGHPDFAAFHHDLYRAVGRGRFWIMEQQSGPVNWAPVNPIPLQGMIKLWAFEALFHGAEVLSIFRWRQVPFAQEQMHSGLLRVDGKKTKAVEELEEFLQESRQLNLSADAKSPRIALIFDYPSCWIHDLEPKACGFNYFQLIFDFYTALRELGQNVDIISKEDSFESYQAIFCPALVGIDKSFIHKIQKSEVKIFAGPRTGSKTKDFQIPDNLGPGVLQDILPIKVSRSESLRHSVKMAVKSADFFGHSYREIIETDLDPILSFEDGLGCLFGRNANFYLGSVLNRRGLKEVCRLFLNQTEIEIIDLPQGTRARQLDPYLLLTNYGPQSSNYTPENYVRILGDSVLRPGQISVYKKL